MYTHDEFVSTTLEQQQLLIIILLCSINFVHRRELFMGHAANYGTYDQFIMLVIVNYEIRS